MNSYLDHPCMFLRPLDQILTNRGKVRLLRVLLPLSRAVSGREAAKLARLSQTPALRALDDLVALGVLRRTETPSQHLYEVNRAHQLVREGLEPLFRAEWERAAGVVDTLRAALDGETDAIASAAVFGSAARGEDVPGSDFDVLVLANEADAVERLHDRLVEVIPQVAEEYGLELSPVVLPLERFREMHRDGDRLPSEASRDSRVFLGDAPEDLLRD